MKHVTKGKTQKDPVNSPLGCATGVQATGPGSVAIGGNVTDSTITNIFYQAAQYKPGPLHQLPSLTENFTGRLDEIDQLCNSVRSRARDGRPIAIISSVHGQGGIGKTELAVAVAYSLLDDFPEAQIILRLAAHSAKPSTPEEVRDALLAVHNPTAKLPDADAARWGCYHQLFQHPDGRPLRALVILDDVADDSQVRKLRPPAGCPLLITSRRKLASGDSFELKTLSPPDAVKLLRAFRPSLSDAEADELARLCGRLTVALQVIGGFLKQNESKPISEYIAELRDDPLARLRHADEALDINIIFARSLRTLPPAQQFAFLSLAVCTSDFDRAAGKAIGICVGDDLDELHALHLLKYDETRHRFFWDDLVQAFALNRLRRDGKQSAANLSKAPRANHAAASRQQVAAEESARLRHARHFSNVGSVADVLYEQKGQMLRGLELFDSERAHLEAAFIWLSAKSDKDSANLLISLVNGVVYTSTLRFHPSQQIAWLEAQANAARLIGYRKAEGTALGDLGHAYAHLGAIRKAIGFYKQQLAIVREIRDRRGKGNALGNLGAAYSELGEMRKGIEFYQQALVIASEIGDRRMEGKIMGNLAVAYKDFGEMRKAIEFQEQALAIAREVGDRHGEGLSLGNLGVAYKNLGETRKAIEFYEQALAIEREMGDRHGEGSSLGNLGNAYADLGEALKAVEFYEQALAINREIGNRRGEGGDLWNSARAFWTLDDLKQAIARAEAALAVFEAIEDPYGAMVRAKLVAWKAAQSKG